MHSIMSTLDLSEFLVSPEKERIKKEKIDYLNGIMKRHTLQLIENENFKVLENDNVNRGLDKHLKLVLFFISIFFRRNKWTGVLKFVTEDPFPNLMGIKDSIWNNANKFTNLGQTEKYMGIEKYRDHNTWIDSKLHQGQDVCPVCLSKKYFYSMVFFVTTCTHFVCIDCHLYHALEKCPCCRVPIKMFCIPACVTTALPKKNVPPRPMATRYEN